MEPSRLPRVTPLRRRRILVMDDNRDAADSLGLLLRLDGHDVRVVYDGMSALDEIARHPPDAALLDIGVPGLDGHELARRIRARPAGGRPLLVALTGRGRQEDRSRSEAAGFDHHLVKPVAVDTLSSLLETLHEPPAGT